MSVSKAKCSVNVLLGFNTVTSYNIKATPVHTARAIWSRTWSVKCKTRSSNSLVTHLPNAFSSILWQSCSALVLPSQVVHWDGNERLVVLPFSKWVTQRSMAISRALMSDLVARTACQEPWLKEEPLELFECYYIRERKRRSWTDLTSIITQKKTLLCKRL